MAVQPLSEGNAAKLYCLNWIDRFVTPHGREVAILDLGCGEALNFRRILQRHSTIEYVGVEPDRRAYLKAVKNLEGLRATFVNAPAYGIDRVVQRQFDVVVSFSVLEHVYRRGEYLRAVRACLKPEGHVLLNYDSGHFLDMTASSRLKDVARRVLARLGVEQYFQAAIPDRELHRLVDGVGLHCVDALFFNAYSLKDFYKMTPPASRDEFMHAWLAFELELNALGVPQTDVLNRCFATRNLILVPG